MGRSSAAANISRGSKSSKGSSSSSRGSSTQRARVEQVRQQPVTFDSDDNRRDAAIAAASGGKSTSSNREFNEALEAAEKAREDGRSTGVLSALQQKELERRENPFLSNLANAAKDYIGMGGFGGMAAKGIGTIFDSVFKPKASTFKGQNNLSIIKNLVKPEDLLDYYNTYKDVINEAGFDTTSDFLKAIDSAPEFGVQGTESQRRADPASYYDEDLFVSSGEQDEMLKDYPEFLEKMGLEPMSSRFGKTTGNLVDIANIPVTSEMQGNNPEFAKKIFEARMELDRMGKDRSGNTQGVMSTPAFTIAPGQDAPPKPGPDTPDAPTGPSFTPQTTSPFDLSQFYAGLPSYSYGQQGVMNPNINPDLAAYFENLKKYYGVG
jgi:hypothetical protein